MHISKRPLNYSTSFYIARQFQHQHQQQQQQPQPQDFLPDIYAPGASEASAVTSASQTPSAAARSRAFTYSLRGSGPGPGKYSRSPSIGHRNHDITMVRNPAYSIGRKLS